MARYGSFLYGDEKYGAEASTTLTWIFEVDWNGDGIFDGTNEAAWMIGLRTRRGRKHYLRIDTSGNAIGFEHAQPGTATVVVTNKSGRYDPYNSDSALYPNIRPGRLARIRVLDSATSTIYPVIAGKITDILPIAGKDQVWITIGDGMEVLQRQDASIDVTTSIAISDAIEALLSEVGWPAAWGTDIEETDDVLSYWWANRRTLTEISDLADAELGTFFVAADGKATYYSRSHIGAALAGIDQTQLGKQIQLLMPWEVIRNVVTVIANPRQLSAEVDLWQMADRPYVAAGESLEVWASYIYEYQPVPATEVVTPVATTHYTMNEDEDGGGADLTANFTVAIDKFGEASKLTFTNAGGTGGYITLGKVRGKAIYIPAVSKLTKSDTTSIAEYESRFLTLDSRWQQSTELASNFAIWLLSFLASPQIFPQVIIEGRPTEQFTPDLFDVQPVTIDKLGVDNNFRVSYIEHQWLKETGQAIRTIFALEPNVDLSGYWQFPTTIGSTSKFGL